MKKYIKILFEPFFADKKIYLLHICLNTIMLFISLGSIELIRKLINSIEKNAGFDKTLEYGIYVIILIFVLLIGNMYKVKYRPITLIKIQKFFQKKYLSKYILLDNEKVNNYGTGKFINIFRGVIPSSEILYGVLFGFTSEILSYVFSLIMIGYININLVFPVIIITFFLLISMKFTSTKTFKNRNKRKILWENESKQILKIFMEKFTILKNGKSEEEINNVLKLRDEVKKESIVISFYVKLLEELSNFIISFGEIILILIIGYFIYKSEATYGDIGAILFIMAIIKKNINSISMQYRQIINYSNDFTRLVDVFEEIPEIKNYENGEKFEYKKGEIKIEKLKYKYPDGKQVFNDLSLEIPEKSKVAFIGKSGSGKSTLVKLILGFIEKDSGKILIDEQEIDSLSKKSYYKHIGYLSQEPNVFDGTVLENIVYGAVEENELGGTQGITPTENSRDVWQKHLEEVIKLANCEFIYELPNGLETKIGEKGVKLSGGERQRLAIARLFLQRPNIIILDEPTSALDSFSEDSISKALDNLSKGKTMITIAHRLQTIKKSDKIFVFENGRIIDSGNHKELINKSGIYKKLVDLQSGEVL